MTSDSLVEVEGVWAAARELLDWVLGQSHRNSDESLLLARS